jgi:WD40 repeat protein
MGNKSSNTYQRQNLLETIVEADSADSMFIGCPKKLMQWSVSLKKVTNTYDDIIPGFIMRMA